MLFLTYDKIIFRYQEIWRSEDRWDRVVYYTNRASLYFGNYITKTTCNTRFKNKSQLWNSIRVWYNLHGTGNLTVVRVCNSRIPPRQQPYVPRYLIRTFHLYKMSILLIIDIKIKKNWSTSLLISRQKFIC